MFSGEKKKVFPEKKRDIFLGKKTWIQLSVICRLYLIMIKYQLGTNVGVAFVCQYTLLILESSSDTFSVTFAKAL